jgi:hypothetical protein
MASRADTRATSAFLRGEADGPRCLEMLLSDLKVAGNVQGAHQRGNDES